MNLCQLNTFFLSPWLVCCVCAAKWPKSVQLAVVHLMIYILQQNKHQLQILNKTGYWIHQTAKGWLMEFITSLFTDLQTLEILKTLSSLPSQVHHNNSFGQKTKTQQTYSIIQLEVLHRKPLQLKLQRVKEIKFPPQMDCHVKIKFHVLAYKFLLQIFFHVLAVLLD